MRIALLTPLLVGASLVLARVPEAAPTEGTVTGTVSFVLDGKGVKSADGFVYLVPVSRGKRVAPKPITKAIEQKDRKFIPKRVVVPMGSIVEFPNKDRETHNVFSPTPPVFDLKKYDGGISKSWQFRDEGEYEIYCDLHVEMNAKVKVVDSDRILPIVNGAFSFAGVPAGKYRIFAWAPDSDESKDTITVVAGETTKVPQLNVQLGKPKSHRRKDGTDYPIYGSHGR